MADVFRVLVPFERAHPVTGEAVTYVKGDLVVDPEMLKAVRESPHGGHGVMTAVPDDHPAVMPHLPDDHPVIVAFMRSVNADAQKRGVAARAVPADQSKAEQQ